MARLIPYLEGSESEEAVRDYADVIMFGRCGIGQKYCFFRKWLKTYYIDLSDIANIHRKVEMVDSACDLGGENLYIQRLIIRLNNGEEVVTKLPGKKEAEKVLALVMQRGIPTVVPGRE